MMQKKCFFMFCFLVCSATTPITFAKVKQMSKEVQKAKKQGAINEPVRPLESLKKPENTSAQVNSGIEIKNGITKNMTGYKHWSGTYYPNSFCTYINGKKIEEGQTITLTNETQATVRCEYEFSRAQVKKFREKKIVLDKTKPHKLELTFDWNNDDRIEVKEADTISQKKPITIAQKK